MYIPYGDYPEDMQFNSVLNNEVLFKDIDFGDFAMNMPPERWGAFTASELFLLSAGHQKNKMTALIMLLSAVERAVTKDHKPLDWHLKSKRFTSRLKVAKNGEDANDILQKEIDSHSSRFSSSGNIAKFYIDWLEREDKLQLIGGITFAHKYTKTVQDNGLTVYRPKHMPAPKLANIGEIDVELAKRIKAVVYDIRNGFVHRSQWLPFGDQELYQDKTIFWHEKWSDGEPKEQWLITMNFEKLHEITKTAFQQYWKNEYDKYVTNRDEDEQTQETITPTK